MEKNWTTHAEFLVLLITLLGGFYMLDGKIERQLVMLDGKILQQASRSDRLYEMFVENQRDFHQEMKNLRRQ